MTSATKFTLEDPKGVQVGSGTLGTAYNKGGLGFTLTAGGTPAVEGDEFTITLAVGTRKYSAYAANGAYSQTAWTGSASGTPSDLRTRIIDGGGP